jgi:prepilin-type N-terminal cleavage/methylation domain-containing protein
MRKNGFTLIEMLVVMAVLSIISGFILTIFTRTLQGGNKAQIVQTMKQNGQTILETIDKNVRSADSISCVSTPAISLVVAKAGVYTRYRFIAPTASANGYIQQDSPVKQIDLSTSKEETDQAFINRVCTNTDPMSQAVIITNTQSISGISVNCVSNDCNANPIFKRDRLAGYKDQILIKFQTEAGVGVPQNLKNQIDKTTFQTTINLR